MASSCWSGGGGGDGHGGGKLDIISGGIIGGGGGVIGGGGGDGDNRGSGGGGGDGGGGNIGSALGITASYIGSTGLGTTGIIGLPLTTTPSKIYIKRLLNKKYF